MLVFAGLLALPAGAQAERAADAPKLAGTQAHRVTSGPSFGTARVARAPALWATVNICETELSPDSMGVRASMPGNGTAQRMYMRFKAEYWSRAAQAWMPVPGSGTSPWVYAGLAEYASRQAGWTFAFATPPAGVTFTMRAQVEFQWRAKRRLVDPARARRAKVIRSATRMTETGIIGVDGGDPEGTSKAMCLIY